MLASCCNWFCLDATIVEDTNSSTRHQAYTNSGYSSHPSPPLADPTCKACGGRFDTPARKHVCMDCKKTYCARCSAQLDPRPRLCHTCQRFHGTLFERTELMKLKVKDLRDYLHLHEVSTQMCREKEELVELVLGQQTPPPDNAGPQTPAPASTTQQEPAPVPAPVTTASVTTAPVTTAPSTQADPPEPAHQPQAQDDNLTPASVSVSSGPEETPDTEADTELQAEQEQQSDTEEVLAPGRRASLSDLASAEDIEALSVRQLKEILARNFVNYKGCCEKWELMERVTRLYHDQKDLQNMVSNTIDGTGDPSTTPGMEDSLCKICMDSPIDCVLLECGHMVTCTKCGKRMNECPICRQYVVRAVHVFRS
ncbi:E3 ubiquitin-protein ligase rififylin isoform X1 [Hypomesus transpacificus]|uniref:E3 ubiquitin-protein ligase rififylin isoform X1 n=1 Tax=Hypomesus transpacificus TaxID=137520 RepID=UPI001F078FDD|nr:E3 ubiquitin-protein ligase rififylin isoform X1 [Hypomesus transpacificus]XP_046891349.1 E3 ubiquitin-protein ligase rififylin isoform X1 [Hypomesus transpacificus]